MAPALTMYGWQCTAPPLTMYGWPCKAPHGTSLVEKAHERTCDKNTSVFARVHVWNCIEIACRLRVWRQVANSKTKTQVMAKYQMANNLAIVFIVWSIHWSIKVPCNTKWISLMFQSYGRGDNILGIQSSHTDYWFKLDTIININICSIELKWDGKRTKIWDKTSEYW